jgi:hypothetical protein
MGNLIQTIAGQDYSRIDDDAFNHSGCIVDLGCARWDWSMFFFDKKRVIGVDPFEEREPEGATLFKGVVTGMDGLVQMHHGGDASCISTDITSDSWINSMSWKNFCKLYDINEISILKMNIEGAEYPLLHSMDSDDFSKINQIIISFHDWLNPNWKFLTEASLYMLNNYGFKMQNIGPWGWYLGIK